LIEIPLIQKDANIIEHREKIAKDFFDLFTAEKSNNFSIVIGGNVSFNIILHFIV
jgi:hypothetical protein